MADTWDHVHSSPQEMRLPQLVLPLEANHGTTQVTLNLYPKSHVWPFCFPNIDTAGNYLDPQKDQPIEERIYEGKECCERRLLTTED